MRALGEAVSQRGAQPAAVFGGNKGFMVSVDDRPVQGPDSTVSVTAESRAWSSIGNRGRPWTCSPGA